MRFEKLMFLIIMMFLISCGNGVNQKELANPATVETNNGYVPAKDAQKLNVQDYINWIQNPGNGFKKEKSIDDITFSVLFKPYEYIICQEEKTQTIYDSIIIRKTGELNEMQYFDLKIELNDGQGELLKHQLTSVEEYNKRVNYFAFEMQKDIQLLDGRDTVSCLLFHFERAYDVSPLSTFLLGFPLTKNIESKEKTLIFYDRTFNKGVLKFTFKKDELKTLPKLQTI